MLPQATQFFVNCLALWYGGKLVAERGIDPGGRHQAFLLFSKLRNICLVTD